MVLLHSSIFLKESNEVSQFVTPLEISDELARFGFFSFATQIIVVDSNVGAERTDFFQIVAGHDFLAESDQVHCIDCASSQGCGRG